MAGDTVAPAVLSISPPNGATGVAADAAIVVRFTEPMDRTKTQTAYQSADLPADRVTFSWSAAGDTLTITPTSKLPYAEGTDTAVQARVFSFVITGAAQDAAGNALGLVTSSFRTARRLTLDLPYLAGLSGDVDDSGIVATSEGFNIYVGWVFETMVRGFVAFDLKALPDSTLAIEKGELLVHQAAVQGNPYVRLAGKMSVDHVSFATLDADAFGRAALRSLGMAPGGAGVEWKNLIVTTALQDDWTQRTARGRRCQFRLSFPRPIGPTIDDHYVEISDSSGMSPRLAATVVMP